MIPSWGEAMTRTLTDALFLCKKREIQRHLRSAVFSLKQHRKLQRVQRLL